MSEDVLNQFYKEMIKEMIQKTTNTQLLRLIYKFLEHDFEKCGIENVDSDRQMLHN